VGQKRFAQIGAGTFGQVHAKAYANHPEVEFAAVCDVVEERARKTAEQYGAARHCTDWREIADDSSIDAVSVVTPDFAHTEIAVGLARAGKHILVEKPFAMTVAECEQIIGAAKDSRVKLMVDFHNRWNPPFHEAHRMARAGEIGVPKLVYFRQSNTTFVPLKMLEWAEKSSVLWFLGSHSVDMVCWLIGEHPNRVYCASRRGVLKEMGVDTPHLFQSTLEFPGGAVATVENCWLLPQTAPKVVDVKCEVVGTVATLYIDTSSYKALEVQNPERIVYTDVLGQSLVHGKLSGFPVATISHFADCVVHDREPAVSGEDGLEITRTLCALEESARRGQVVEIKR